MAKGFLTLGLLFLFLFSYQATTAQTAEAEKNFAVCKACHTIGGGRLVGPDLKGVTERREEAWLLKFIKNSQEMVLAGDPIAVQLFEEYNKIPMPPNPLTDDQIRDILLYIEAGGVTAEGAEVEAEVELIEEAHGLPGEAYDLLEQMHENDARHMQPTFIAMIVLILISLFDLLISKIVPWRWIHVAIILISLAIIGEIVFVEATNLGRQQFYQPEQPVWFSHKVHAGQNQINCQYCHFTANKSMHAGIPPVQVCMNCHNQVKSGKITGTVEIDKVVEAYKSGKPIEWIKVHNLPDHVYFNHAQHVNVGKVECQQCHGQVEKMDEIIQINSLGMGWCIECHRSMEINIENKFYDQYKELHAKLADGELKRARVVDVGGEDCQRCHY